MQQSKLLTVGEIGVDRAWGEGPDARDRKEWCATVLSGRGNEVPHCTRLHAAATHTHTHTHTHS